MTADVKVRIPPTPEVVAANERARRLAIADLRRIREADRMDALDHQERHSPTEAVMVQITGTRVRQQGRRRKMDARLIESLSPDQERAADAIVAAWRILSQGLGGGIMRYDEAVSRGAAADGESADDYRHKLLSRYIEWGLACPRSGIHRGAVMQVIAYGHSPNAVDCAMRKQHGWVKANLLEGLTLYCKIHRIG